MMRTRVSEAASAHLLVSSKRKRGEPEPTPAEAARARAKESVAPRRISVRAVP
jgi:hypothetical protein